MSILSSLFTYALEQQLSPWCKAVSWSHIIHNMNAVLLAIYAKYYLKEENFGQENFDKLITHKTCIIQYAKSNKLFYMVQLLCAI